MNQRYGQIPIGRYWPVENIYRDVSMQMMDILNTFDGRFKTAA